MSISAAQVKELREKTGVGMMDCKKALSESDGDFEKAVQWLREKGIARAAKKADRETKEGRIVTKVIDDGKKAVIVELNCETDFVANNDEFVSLANQVADAVLDANIATLEELEGISVGGAAYPQFISDSVLKLGENISTQQFATISTSGLVFDYVHMNGKIAVLVEFSGEIDAEIGAGIAMHVAAASPAHVNKDEIPQSVIDAEREVLKKQVLAEGKPENIVDKIVDGKIAKFAKEICLVEQDYVKDPSKTVKSLLPSGVEVVRFIRYAKA